MNSAEQVFAEEGYARASFSEIARRAKVTQALLNYYFKSKENLFREVYLRRARSIVKGRLDALDDLMRLGRPFSLAELISAFLNPAFAIRRHKGGKAFLRMQWRLLHSEPPRFARSLHRELYDDIARSYVAKICELVPELSQKAAFWRMVFIVGIFSYINSDTHRLEELSHGLCNANDVNEMLSQASSFILAGMMAPDPDRGTPGILANVGAPYSQDG